MSDLEFVIYLSQGYAASGGSSTLGNLTWYLDDPCLYPLPKHLKEAKHVGKKY